MEDGDVIGCRLCDENLFLRVLANTGTGVGFVVHLVGQRSSLLVNRIALSNTPEIPDNDSFVRGVALCHLRRRHERISVGLESMRWECVRRETPSPPLHQTRRNIHTRRCSRAYPSRRCLFAVRLRERDEDCTGGSRDSSRIYRGESIQTSTRCACRSASRYPARRPPHSHSSPILLKRGCDHRTTIAHL